MSKYKVIKTKLKSTEDIIAGLKAIGIPENCIEVYSTKRHLMGFSNDTRDQLANVIVNRQNINKYLSGGLSNDLGFEKQGDEFVAHVSDYDERWWSKKSRKFMNHAALNSVIETAKVQGYSYEVVEKEDEILIELEKY